jgi:hypothetical protein
MTATAAGTATTPIFGLLATASVVPQLREVGLFNSTVTACTYELVSVTGGTPGATVTAYPHRTNQLATPTCLAKQLYTGTSTAVKTGYRMVLGAAIGSGAILTFGADGVSCAFSASLALIPVGTGQVCEVYFVWDE